MFNSLFHWSLFRLCVKKGTREMKLLDEAKKLADDIREYAPDTNIELMIRDLIKEIERLQSEKIAQS
jgi:NurA-like 5'-3' nuclease